MKKTIKTSFGKLKFDRKKEAFCKKIKRPIFKENTCDIYYPFSWGRINFDSIKQSFLEEESDEELRIPIRINCDKDDLFVSNIQLETVELLFANLELVQQLAFKKINEMKQDYLTRVFSTKSNNHLGKDLTKERRILSEFIGRPEVEKKSLSLEGISILGRDPRYNGYFTLEFSAFWMINEGFFLLFNGLEIVGVGGLNGYDDW